MRTGTRHIVAGLTAIALNCAQNGSAREAGTPLGHSVDAQANSWTVVIQRSQPIRIQRAFIERTPDASIPYMATVPAGVNPLVAILVQRIGQVMANVIERERKASEEDLVVSTDQSVGAAVAVGDTTSLKKYETQNDANQVIRPYVDGLSGTSLFDLLAVVEPTMSSRGLRLASDADSARHPDKIIHVAPSFIFAADQRSVSVDAVVGFGPSASTAISPADQRVVRIQVYSTAGDSLDISDYWLKENGKELRATLSTLLLSAIDLAVQRFAMSVSDTAAPQRTFRFRTGTENLYVRGALAEMTCDRLLIEGLQGQVISVPAAALRDRELLPESCR